MKIELSDKDKAIIQYIIGIATAQLFGVIAVYLLRQKLSKGKIRLWKSRTKLYYTRIKNKLQV